MEQLTPGEMTQTLMDLLNKADGAKHVQTQAFCQEAPRACSARWCGSTLTHERPAEHGQLPARAPCVRAARRGARRARHAQNAKEGTAATARIWCANARLSVVTKPSAQLRERRHRGHRASLQTTRLSPENRRSRCRARSVDSEHSFAQRHLLRYAEHENLTLCVAHAQHEFLQS